METDDRQVRFDDFFRVATGHRPFGYQSRLACGERLPDETEKDWLARRVRCESRLIHVPTGLGKTAGVVLAWLWNRIQIRNPKSEIRNSEWPRRLVYCLPMRTLVEQTAGEVARWLGNLQAKADDLGFDERSRTDLAWLNDHSPVILMGGEEADREWDIYPEKPCILIGTQDMLLSRALNRGYGMSRYRWPMHFGLLNNDCLWVMDETQLMGPGLGTACQLEGFRGSAPHGFGSFGPSGPVTWYMSATSAPEILKTREWRNVSRPNGFEFDLDPVEKTATAGLVHQRRFAVKQLKLKQAENLANPVSAKKLAEAVLERHAQMVAAIGSNSMLQVRTLFVSNTVDHAVGVHALLSKELPAGCELLLLHSRFRPPERREQVRRLTGFNPADFPNGQIVVSTQVVEAGVDVSSGVLWSEIAPLASLVQRLGRLNRAGEFNGPAWPPNAIIVGVGFEPAPPRETKEQKEKREKDNAKRCLPYDWSRCEEARVALEQLKGDGSPASLEQIQTDIANSIPRCPYSLQRHELLDFFDTDANLSLGFTDVSPFVRGLDGDTDLQVLWRESWPEKEAKPDFSPDYQRDELCPVPISKARDARDILNQGWLWRGKESGWISVRDAGLAPGMTILLPLSAGGYDTNTGWTSNPDDKHFASHYQPGGEPSDEERLSCLTNGWRSIAAHTSEVAYELDDLLRDLLAAKEIETERAALLGAVPWHDIGKNHPGWQQAVVRALEKAGIAGKETHQPFAKFSLADSPSLFENGQRLEGDALKTKIRELRNSFRPGIAHEVASALAFRQFEQARLGPARDTSLASLLAEYVVMSHHGRVRKVLRDEIPKFPNDEKDADSVRGIRDDDSLPSVLIEGQPLGSDALSTDCRKMGRPGSDGHESYTRGVLRLLEHYGPFRLAFFEALFRVADMRASKLAASPPPRPIATADELRETPPAYTTEPATLAHLVPWSHPWLDQLGLRYHEAIAQKLRADPSRRQVAVDNIDRWMARNDYPVSTQKSLRWWRDMLTRAPLDHLIAVMLDPSEAGHQRRQNTPFPGILTQAERRAILQAHEAASTP
jgi:CRISPR-associated endonuclease/helicase Cas3